MEAGEANSSALHISSTAFTYNVQFADTEQSFSALARSSFGEGQGVTVAFLCAPCRMCGSIPGLSPPDARSISSPATVTIENVPDINKHSLEGKITAWLTITELDKNEDLKRRNGTICLGNCQPLGLAGMLETFLLSKAP